MRLFLDKSPAILATRDIVFRIEKKLDTGYILYKYILGWQYDLIYLSYY